MAHIDAARGVFADVFEGASGRERPLFIPPEISGELAQVSQMAVYRRTEYQGWAFAMPQNTDACLQAFHNAVLRNIHNGHCRRRRHRVAPMAGGRKGVALTDGATLIPPEEDASVPDAPYCPESQRPHPCTPRGVSVSQDSPGGSVAAPNAQTPKRERATNTDEECLKRHCATLRMVANTRGTRTPVYPGDAIGRALMHGCAFGDLYALESGASTIEDAGLPARETFARNVCTDPMSRALLAAGATVVDKTEFRTVVENGAL